MSEKPEKKDPASKKKKTHPWSFDPSTFQPPPTRGFFRRYIFDRVKSLGKYVAYSLAFSYPLTLVSVGIIFGGIAFWATLVGSVGLMYVIIRKAGYARNFAEWGVGSGRFLGLLAALGVVPAFFFGLTHLGLWAFAIFSGVLIIGLVLALRSFR